LAALVKSQKTIGKVAGSFIVTVGVTTPSQFTLAIVGFFHEEKATI
jgi:hypothetical protein